MPAAERLRRGQRQAVEQRERVAIAQAADIDEAVAHGRQAGDAGQRAGDVAFARPRNAGAVEHRDDLRRGASDVLPAATGDDDCAPGDRNIGFLERFLLRRVVDALGPFDCHMLDNFEGVIGGDMNFPRRYADEFEMLALLAPLGLQLLIVEGADSPTALARDQRSRLNPRGAPLAEALQLLRRRGAYQQHSPYLALPTVNTRRCEQPMGKTYRRCSCLRWSLMITNKNWSHRLSWRTIQGVN